MKVDTTIKVGVLTVKVSERQPGTAALRIKTGIKAGPTCRSCGSQG
jgi:hypothetical protein